MHWSTATKNVTKWIRLRGRLSLWLGHWCTSSENVAERVHRRRRCRLLGWRWLSNWATSEDICQGIKCSSCGGDLWLRYWLSDRPSKH